jgi:glycosyltransferase involved in cell wall biosynthesis
VPKDDTIELPGDQMTSATVDASELDASCVAILLATKDGAAFLSDQLRSFANQSHTNWFVVVSDDGSRDATCEMIERFATQHPQRVLRRAGPRKGVAANFLSLAADPSIKADFYAFSDQDDVWHADKLSRALTRLATVAIGTPALYCGRTDLMTEDGRCYGLSPLFRRRPSFRNALVQNLGGGNTMVFNRATKQLVAAAGVQEVVLHDWWLYLLVTAAGGSVFYDPQPTVKYRQHGANVIGSNRGRRAGLLRIQLMLGGRFRRWNETNIAALQRIPAHLMTAEHRRILKVFAEARTARLPRRLVRLWQSGVYRQRLLGNLGIWAAAVLNRL